jgi:phage terminase small subunit
MSRSLDGSTMKWLDAFGLNDRQRSFVLAYLKELNSTKAARQAGYKHPNTQGPRLLVNVCIAAAVRKGRAQIERKLMFEAEDIAQYWFDIATADMNDLVQHIHGACRYCYGIEFEYQWKTPREFRDEMARVVDDFFADDDLRTAAMAGEIEDRRLPTDNGGYGYRITDDPNPDCPECAGLGIEHVRMADTSKLTGSAKLLYDGVETTQAGKKIKVQSRERALENLAKHLGMFFSKVEMKWSGFTGQVCGEAKVYRV